MKKPYSNTLVSLLKGVVYSNNEQVWKELLAHEADVRRYFTDIYLDVIIDKSEGFAYLKQRKSEEEETELPRLTGKRQLSFSVSLLCLLIRKHLIENDSEGETTRATLTRDEIIDRMKPFYKDAANEAKQIAHIESSINKVVSEGFLRRMKTEDERYEINRIVKAFINADVVLESLEKLKTHSNQLVLTNE